MQNMFSLPKKSNLDPPKKVLYSPKNHIQSSIIRICTCPANFFTKTKLCFFSNIFYMQSKFSSTQQGQLVCICLANFSTGLTKTFFFSSIFYRKFSPLKNNCAKCKSIKVTKTYTHKICNQLDHANLTKSTIWSRKSLFLCMQDIKIHAQKMGKS